MDRRFSLMVMALALVTAAPAAPADAAHSPAHTKRQAEVNVLRVVAQKWKPRRMPGLVNPRTHLLANNTEAVCRGRGGLRKGNRYSRFVCVVRPQIHNARQGLYVSDHARPKGRFKLRWLFYRRH
jgi:hypothetical protein